jgi:hypothetical protein
MTTGREREWSAEWQDDRQAREQEQQERDKREAAEPAYRVLAAAGRPRRKVFLVQESEFYDYDEFSYYSDIRSVRAFLSQARATQLLHQLPPLDAGASVKGRKPSSYRTVELPLLGDKRLPERPEVVQIVCRTFPRYDDEEFVPLAAFLDSEEAGCFRRECVKAFQEIKNPLECPRMYTTIPEEVFCDWILELGLELPQQRLFEGWDLTWRCWREWWEQKQPTMTDWQRLKIWEVMDIDPLYKVIEVECE